MYILGKLFFSAFGIFGTFACGFLSAFALEGWFFHRKWKEILSTVKGGGNGQL